MCPRVVLLLLFLAHLSRAAQQCQPWQFEYRPDLDNYVSTAGLITENSGVSLRSGCVSHCLATPLCNLALYNPNTSTCRLYQEAFNSSANATPEPGWQYYGVPCNKYRMENLGVGSHVLTSDPSSMCADGHRVTYDVCEESSCFDGTTWTEFTFKCVYNDTYMGPSYADAAFTTMTLPFDLQPGHKLSFQVSGVSSEANRMNLVTADGDKFLHLAVRYHFSPPETILNTQRNGNFLVMHRKARVPTTRLDYTIWIYIYEAEIKAVFNDEYSITMPFQMTFTTINTITFTGFNFLDSEVATFEIC